MISYSTFLGFMLATFLLNITPGPDMIYVSTRSIQQGTKTGIISSFGIATGQVVHIIAAALGMSAILAKSTLAFNILKYTGAAYLVYLGVTTFMKNSKEKEVDHVISLKNDSLFKIFFQGVLTSVFNPKVAIFFLSFLPQFINGNAGNTVVQILILGVYFIFSSTTVSIIISIITGKTGSLLKGTSKSKLWLERTTGTVFLLLGLKLALSTQK
ncbi:LysE family translocator [Clostridium sp. MSJ-11]|uniref:LysE family translocator n=1 Tax=Clostridium mobile TaxID=2841512 RepID=A0ABS6EI73_9CLOT|nr:LysE family translocator [Clostridium mobile]MBU5484738.1 LysE family translocator [Clostridium mobile]